MKAESWHQVYPIILKPMIATLYRPGICSARSCCNLVFRVANSMQGQGQDSLTTHWATGWCLRTLFGYVILAWLGHSWTI